MSARLNRQRGVAIITALLLTSLAITIVASLFWQQQVQVRSIENQRLQLQKQWILRGAMDWAMLILSENAKNAQYDDLTQAWAVPLEDTKLDQYVENGRTSGEASEASLSGLIVDAQSFYNLKNLATNRVVNPKELAVFARLLTSVRADPKLAKAVADAIAATQPKPPPVPGTPPDVSPPPAQRPLEIEQLDDLLSVPGFTTEVLAKLKDLVIVLPKQLAGNPPPITPVNVNTASAQVLSARIEGLSLADAAALVAVRDHASFRDISYLNDQLKGRQLTVGPEISVRSNFFLVNGKVNLSRASMSVQAMVERQEVMGTKCAIRWIREN